MLVYNVKQSKPKPKPWFFDLQSPITFLPPDMRIFLETGGLGESSPASEFLILGYGKKWNFRGGAKT